MQRDRITVRFEPETSERLSDIAAARSVTSSQLIREAVRKFLAADDDRSETALEVAMRSGILGMVDGLPGDLSTNPERLEGFGGTRKHRHDFHA